MPQTVNNYDNRYSSILPKLDGYYYSCKDCGEMITDRPAHNRDHRTRADPVIVFAKMSEIVTILWGQDGC